MGESIVQAIGLVLAASIPAWFAYRAAHHSKRTNKAVGDANGNGTATEMLEKTLGNTTETLGWQAHTDKRLARVEGHLGLEPLEQ